MKQTSHCFIPHFLATNASIFVEQLEGNCAESPFKPIEELRLVASQPEHGPPVRNALSMLFGGINSLTGEASEIEDSGNVR
jgi:hypothetical protein